MVESQIVKSKALLLIDLQNQFLCEEIGGKFAKKHRKIDDLCNSIRLLIEETRQDPNIVIVWITSTYPVVLKESSPNQIFKIQVETHRGRTPCCVQGTPSAELYRPFQKLVNSESDICIQDKQWYSSFKETDLHDQLRAYNPPIQTLILAGVHSNVCVLATALDAKHLGYEVSVVESCTAAFRVSQHQRAIQTWIDNDIIILP
jgi:nicotinamidase-related amidase